MMSDDLALWHAYDQLYGSCEATHHGHRCQLTIGHDGQHRATRHDNDDTDQLWVW